jgi:hypothetical protein
LPAWFYPDDAPFQPFEEKRDLMLVSPDPDPNRERILKEVATAFPELEIRIIQDVPFSEYIKLERLAKWSLTFGEGMDAYFLGIFLRGGVGFAVYNDNFFTPEFRDLPTVYSTFDEMHSRISSDIRYLDSKVNMESYNAQVRPRIAACWGPEKTRLALESFYQKRYTHP